MTLPDAQHLQSVLQGDASLFPKLAVAICRRQVGKPASWDDVQGARQRCIDGAPRSSAPRARGPAGSHHRELGPRRRAVDAVGARARGAIRVAGIPRGRPEAWLACARQRLHAGLAAVGAGAGRLADTRGVPPGRHGELGAASADGACMVVLPWARVARGREDRPARPWRGAEAVVLGDFPRILWFVLPRSWSSGRSHGIPRARAEAVAGRNVVLALLCWWAVRPGPRRFLRPAWRRLALDGELWCGANR